jgi:hypothetical protein
MKPVQKGTILSLRINGPFKKIDENGLMSVLIEFKYNLS